MANQKEIENNSRPDIISNLPSNIIDNILVFLPIHEAVKTSILSKKWRFNWRYLPKLVFDSTFYQTSIRPSSTAKPNITKLFLNIYKVLLLHRGPIFNFTFNVPLFQGYPEIDQLMLYLSEKDVHEFYFDIGTPVFGCYTLSSFLFSFVTLRRLTLSSCLLEVPLAFQGFPKLISLSVHIKFNEFKTFISKCPLLETLSIKSCFFGMDNFVINFPHLKFFQFDGCFISIYFRKTCQHLSTVIFDGDFISGHEIYEGTKLFESLPLIEHLRLGSGFIDYMVEGTMPRKLSTTLGFLRVLELPELNFRFTEKVSFVLCLIVSSPNLEILEIGSVSYMDEIQLPLLALEILEVQDLLDNALKRLRVVKIEILHTEEVKPELEFIKFLLAESIVLEKMFIQPRKGTIAEEGLQILKETLQFQCSSKKAEIEFLDAEDDGEVSSDGSQVSSDGSEVSSDGSEAYDV
ncbi:F-box/FBD/LRR-repeat protein At1g13570-like [Mercurialis annua]|uniref:F-box/FBD/LRR-repeat protein At1g13570-like n=1 Tax=Mercurialis annua TaxID=3986 RepID=UPI00215F09A7|nr:F-box/FBD/LRR-repeat protein At1g13570-like [Mercurialis annua]XP_055961234.1 F-box/FBD/LRR-repeat protein At1g13570-like [Mercurialis annua]